MRLVLAPDPGMNDIGPTAWNQPTQLVLPPGVTLPNISPQYTTGFVAVVGNVGEGDAVPYNAAPPTRTRILSPFGGAGSAFTGLAFGARRVFVLAVLAYTAVVNVNIQGGATASVPIPINTWVDLPAGAFGVTITAAGALASGVQLTYELGL